MRIGHPSNGALLRYGDSRGGRPATISRHLERCQQCRDRLASLRSVPEAVRAATTPPAPSPDLWSDIERDLDAGRKVILPDVSTAKSRGEAGERGRARRWYYAAGLALLMAGGAMALAGSPLWDRIVARPTASASPIPALSVAAAVPEGGLSLVIEEPASDIRLGVFMSDGELVEVEVRGDGPEARFRTAGDRLVLTGAAGDVVVRIPRQRGSVLVESGGRILVATEGHGLLRMGAEDGSRSEVLLTIRARSGSVEDSP